MKINFRDYLKTRLTDKEIAEIEQEAQLEADILRVNQKYDAEYREFVLSELLLAAMAKDNISVRKLEQ